MLQSALALLREQRLENNTPQKKGKGDCGTTALFFMGVNAHNKDKKPI